MNDNKNPTAAQPLDLEALDKLEALARAASPGEWKSGYGNGVMGTRAAAGVSWDLTDVRSMPVRVGDDVVAWVAGFKPSDAEIEQMCMDAEFIAAANPQTILALLSHARASQPEGATGTTGASVLPPLPEPFGTMCAEDDEGFYTAGQMRAYGQTCAHLAAKDQGDAKLMATAADECDHSFCKAGERCPECGEFKRGAPQPASAQPDRGVSPIDERALFEKWCASQNWERSNQAEDWEVWQARASIAPSPASQPVPPTDNVLAAICEEAGYANLSMQSIREILAAHGCMIAPSAVAPSDAKGKADAANAGGLTPLDYRAQGREEALAIILAQSAEDPFSECIGYSRSGAPDDEGGCYWEEEKLRALLHIGDKTHDAYDRAEAAYWDALGHKDEAKREMLFVEQAPFYKPLHDFLRKHEAWDLMGDLKRAASQSTATSAADAKDAEIGFYKRLSQQAQKEAMRESVRDAVAEALDGLYTCGRVWSAWSYGTMSEDDFTPADEVDEVLDEITDAAIAAQQTAPVAKGEHSRFGSPELQARIIAHAQQAAPVAKGEQSAPDQFARGYFCAVAVLLREWGDANADVRSLFSQGGDPTKADPLDVELFIERGLLDHAAMAAAPSSEKGGDK